MPPASPTSPAEPIRELAALLRAAGLDPSAEELADALWLAGRTAGPPGEPGTRPARVRRSRTPARADSTRPPRTPEPAREDTGPEDPVTLYPAGRRFPGAEVEVEAPAGLPVRVPGATALPRIMDVQRALRALQRRRPAAPATRTVLDEAATAEASARALGLVIPVLRSDSRREATVRLVMDASPSMAVWQDLFDELRSVCERLGAFRDVQVHYLHRLGDGTALIGRGPSPGGALRSGEQLRDPTGRTLTMVVSDCAGPVWREGEAQRLLYRWAECAPCVVVQPLPQRLWGRSWLPTERGELSRSEGCGRTLRFRPERPPRPGRPTGGLTVPVLPPHAHALGAWARLVAGLGTGPVPAEVGRVLADHPAAPAPPPRAARPPRELVSRFRSSASPGAVQLAVYLAAAPLTLPVMRLVQRTMLPDSEPSDLAEVLLSGLLRRGPDSGWYTFVPGVRDVLLGPLGRDEAALVLKHCSEYVLAHFGRGVRNFPALAVSQLTGAAVDSAEERMPAGRLPQAFAQVSAKVVRRYLPGPPPDPAEAPPPPATPAVAAREQALRTALARPLDGGQRGLYETVTLLRRAVAAPPGPDDPPGEAEAELAGALLRLWALQRDPELLAEAERAVEGQAAARSRALRGRVLYERALAGVAPDGGLPDGALLEAADREFTAAGAAPGTDRALRLDCAVRRARTLVRLGELRHEPGALREARAALEALADPDEPAAAGEAEARRARELGRVLLALLPHTPDPTERAALAEEAAARLTADPRAEPEARARVRVERAAALSHLPGRLEEASGELATALTETGEAGARVAALVWLARVHRARYARDADPRALEDAAEAYGRARRLIPRDGDAFGELLPEWGDALLDRARAPDAEAHRFASTAVRVLRESRAAVPQSDPRAGHRLRRLAAGLRLRHAYEGDVVDLREAEYLLELAARHGRGPLERAGAWREHGDVQREIHGHTRAVDRLDRAADSYRRAWREASETQPGPDREAALRLAVRAQELRGEVLERLARPRAALDAYRSAVELWQGLGGGDAERRTERLRARIRVLEAGL
ncbi:SAV_2336 N-terminal domain-related protein [Streptomyces sp. NPDC060010]|uniref:SAV_2336 N-terminal domain-related protein n=1 Tax=Streptomyces sp. NPDC060010 TaxID=3347036 RepID=UPI0036828739